MQFIWPGTVLNLSGCIHNEGYLNGAAGQLHSNTPGYGYSRLDSIHYRAILTIYVPEAYILPTSQKTTRGITPFSKAARECQLFIQPVGKRAQKSAKEFS